jgi:ATP-dependent DNA ligase
MLWRSAPPARRPPGFIEPCLPTLADAVPTGAQWVYEINHDGFRFICRRDGEQVRVFSRRGHDSTDRVPLIAEALTKLRADVCFWHLADVPTVFSDVRFRG